ncbi:nucleotidyltransferase domain-containing protein [Candidatus Woesearchaeota archaeon]|nr:hypothetical protein [uncultured archaeon]MBS3123792.1 nucleotidyltransferase domain-containing protein [Candidatus Woesearchaeota archaeon]
MIKKLKKEWNLKKEPNIEVSENYRNVLSYFFSFPNQHIGLNDLSKYICSSKTSTKLTVNHLVKQGFIKKEVIGKAWRLSVDSSNKLMITKKIPYNLQLVYKSGIIDAVYDKVPNALAVILFGSYRWGTDNENSDIDIAVEVIDNESMRIKTLEVIEIGFRKRVTVNLHIFSRKKIDLNLFTNIANGIVLDGLLEVRP